ncbi:hypothetical protein Nmel_001522, partial [Mimus melanotis]
ESSTPQNVRQRDCCREVIRSNEPVSLTGRSLLPFSFLPFPLMPLQTGPGAVRGADPSGARELSEVLSRAARAAPWCSL